jgi:hypothetical protein
MPDNPRQKIYGLDEAQAFVKKLSTWVGPPRGTVKANDSAHSGLLNLLSVHPRQPVPRNLGLDDFHPVGIIKASSGR